MFLIKSFGRFFRQIESLAEIKEVKLEIVKETAAYISLLPYQVIFANSSSIKYFDPEVKIKNIGRLAEVLYEDTENNGKIMISTGNNITILDVKENCFVDIDRFVFATSQIKVTEKNEGFEVTGHGKIAIEADELKEVSQKNLLVRCENLAGHDYRIKKELVKINEILFWNVYGPGTIALDWKNNYSKISGEGVKKFDFNIGKEEKKKGLDSILNSNDIVI